MHNHENCVQITVFKLKQFVTLIIYFSTTTATNNLNLCGLINSLIVVYQDAAMFKQLLFVNDIKISIYLRILKINVSEIGNIKLTKSRKKK